MSVFFSCVKAFDAKYFEEAERFLPEKIKVFKIFHVKRSISSSSSSSLVLFQFLGRNHLCGPFVSQVKDDNLTEHYFHPYLARKESKIIRSKIKSYEDTVLVTDIEGVQL